MSALARRRGLLADGNLTPRLLPDAISVITFPSETGSSRVRFDARNAVELTQILLFGTWNTTARLLRYTSMRGQVSGRSDDATGSARASAW
jgi:hypothetical protein